MVGHIEELNDTLLQETFTSKFRSGYVRLKGCTLPRKFLDLADDVFNLEVREDDVWICSFPKTGTTWTQEMVWMIANNVDFKGGEEVLGDRFPFLEISAIFDFKDLMNKIPEFKPPDAIVDSIKFVKNMKGRRFIKTHLPWNLLPNEIQSHAKSPKIVYVARNPKDAFVSYYYHSKLMEGYTGNFQQFYQLYFENKVNYAPFWDNVLPYWERRNQPNMLFITYEDMKADLSGIIRKVTRFLGVTLTEQKIQQLEKHLSFESMRANRSVNYEVATELHKKFNIISYDGAFMRSGATGQYKSVMTQDMIKKFDDWIKEHTRDTDFPYYH